MWCSSFRCIKQSNEAVLEAAEAAVAAGSRFSEGIFAALQYPNLKPAPERNTRLNQLLI